jgi:phosphoribosylanthranilate isomerase
MRAPEPAAKLTELLARPLVKVCGLTREEGVALAAEAGADVAGFVLAASSPRRAAEVLPVPGSLLSVAVCVGEAIDSGADLVQLYEDEDGHRGRDAVLLRDGAPVATVLDLPWLDEDDGHWERARSAVGRVMLAGGLDAETVRAAIDRVRPWAVDGARGTESAPGVKDPVKLRRFVEAARD